MRILILNRRDIANPAGGGAEIYTHEIASGLVKKYRCDVSVFSNLYNGGIAEESIDGVRYIRKGNEVTVHALGCLYAIKHRNEFDLIIDEFNGLGFFTFFLSQSSILIHQIYKEFWFRELGIFGIIPYVSEPLILKLYRKKPAVTVSNSTKEDLERIGFTDVTIIMNAVRFASDPPSNKKEQHPTLVFLGRLKSTKKPEDAIEIFKLIKENIPEVQLWIIGRGPEEKKMKIMTKGLKGITFCGWVNEEKKMSLLGKSHILLVPGVREGFGINVIEAASTGTPAIGYHVHGLRDSIRHGETGYLVKSIQEAASRILELFSNKTLYEKMSNNCLYYAKEFDWNTRVDEFWHKICLKFKHESLSNITDI